MGEVVIEKQGILPSGRYFVTFNTMGNRCGYLEVGNRTFKLLHSEHRERYIMLMGDSFGEVMGASRRFKHNNLSRQIASLYVDRLDVHGGVTFAGNMSELAGLDTNVNVVGFDYAHIFDGMDEKAYMKYFPDKKRFFSEIKGSRHGEVQRGQKEHGSKFV